MRSLDQQILDAKPPYLAKDGAVGDRVVLATGGPEMTVVHIDRDSEMVDVMWFSDTTINKEKLPAHALKESP